MIDLEAEGRWPREVLDRDYAPRSTVPVDVFEETIAAYRALSDEARASAASHLDVCYDEASGQTLDIFGAGSDPRPVFVFIHGGYWRSLSKRDSAFMAKTLARKGIMTAAIDYRLAPAVTLTEIVHEVRKAISFLWRNADKYGIDASRIFVGGSSAGGHLSGAVFAGGWHGLYDVPDNIVRGGLPVSGLFELAPIAASHVQDWMHLTPDEIAALSPIRHVPSAGCPIVVAYADGEPSGFERQSTAYAGHWRDAGHGANLLKIEGRHHFDVVLDLSSEKSELTTALVNLVGATG